LNINAISPSTPVEAFQPGIDRPRAVLLISASLIRISTFTVTLNSILGHFKIHIP
jgi:hypothetical protein